MRIVLFGANGIIGQRIAREALERGHTISAVARHPAPLSDALTPGLTVVQGDATDAASVAHASRGADAIVSAVGPGHRPDAEPSMLSTVAHALIAGARDARVKRLVVVGGAGSLRTPEGALVMDRPTFPAAWKNIAKAHADALDVYRKEADTAGLDWTYLSPADVIEPGTRTGHYRSGHDDLVVDTTGKSTISTEDFAVALLDELEQHRHSRQRMTVAY